MLRRIVTVYLRKGIPAVTPAVSFEHAAKMDYGVTHG